MQILRNVANFMFVNVFLYHFGSNFVRFERKKCHLCGTCVEHVPGGTEKVGRNVENTRIFSAWHLGGKARKTLL